MLTTQQIVSRPFWRERRLSNWLLLPIAALYGTIIFLRSQAYRTGLFKAWRAPVPVVVAGSIIAGGGGKTTLVTALLTGLQDRGLRPGVVARGHGGTHTGPLLVTSESDPTKVGDEAVMIASMLAVPVAIGADRPAAVRLLLGHYPDLNVVISDDGLQHLALHRDFELVVLSADFDLGNRWLLPAGPLREPRGRLQTIDAIVRKGQPQTEHEYALTLDTPRLTDVQGNEIAAATLAQKRVIAFAGIAEPEGFFTDLQTWGVTPAAYKIFPDHFAYRKSDLQSMAADTLVTTAKDAIKCRKLDESRLVTFTQTATLDPDLLNTIVKRVHQAKTA